MKLPFLTSVIVFILVLGRRIKRQNRLREKENNAFWEREARANATRRKSLDNLNYITIPLEQLPTEILCDDPEVLDCIRLLRELSTQKIVNLTGFTNTDLKLQYGAPNITELSEYDQNYTVLARTLQKWADLLIAAGYMEQAARIMEFAISTGTDISRTYYALAAYREDRGETEQIRQLVSAAENLRSANRNAILRNLRVNYLHEI